MKKVTMKDIGEIKFISQLAVSPNGRSVAFVLSSADISDNSYHSDIWMLEDGKLRRITVGDKTGKFIWFDDTHLLFPGDRRKAHKPQPGKFVTVFNLIDVNGGEAEEFFTVPAKVAAIKRIGDNRYLLTAEYDHYAIDIDGLEGAEKAEAIAKIEEEKDYEVFDELPFCSNGKGIVNKKRNRLYLFEAKSGKLDLISPPYMNVTDFSYDATSEKVLYFGCDYEWMDHRRDDMYVKNLVSGEIVQIKLDRKFGINSALFIDGKIAFAASDYALYGNTQNPSHFIANPESGVISRIADLDIAMSSTVASDCRYGEGTVRKAHGSAWYFLTTEGASSYIMRLSADGKVQKVSPDVGGSVDCFDFIGDKLIYVAMRKDGLQEIYCCGEGAEEEKLTEFNDGYLKSHYISTPIPLSIASGKDAVDGWVILPVDYDPQKSYPAILDVHGGPKTAYGEVFYHEMQLWASEGYFVFFCNPHGSDGKGNEFADIRGPKYGALDYDDIMRFTDAVLEKYPQIDKSRVGMTGGSYGGFMANWIVGHTDRFAAVASQRSISNYISKCLTTDIGYYHNLYAMQADPWNGADILWDHSPLKYADKCKTPTLFIHSDEDYRCWMGDAMQMFTALRMHGCPTRLCLFHGENHTLSRSGKPKHRIRRLKEITDWFEKYLK